MPNPCWLTELRMHAYNEMKKQEAAMERPVSMFLGCPQDPKTSQEGSQMGLREMQRVQVWSQVPPMHPTRPTTARGGAKMTSQCLTSQQAYLQDVSSRLPDGSEVLKMQPSGLNVAQEWAPR